jgi:hypothetical protein
MERCKRLQLEVSNKKANNFVAFLFFTVLFDFDCGHGMQFVK